MKKIFTFISALCLSYGLAQAQDTSSWKAGDDVTDQLEWKNPSGANPSGEDTYGDWQYNATGMGAYDYQEWEMYDKAEGAETYQIFYLPAGVYTFSVQGFYRGTYNPDYWDGSEQIYADFFAESVTLDEETGEVAEVTRTQSTNMASIASSQVSSGRLFTSSEWTNDVAYTYEETEYYVPNCMEGTRIWFDAGYYDTNTLRVAQLADGYIKVGVRKTGHLAGDWTIFSNFRATYEGDASEAIQVELAREDFEKVCSEADALSDQFSAYPALGAYYDEAKGDLTDKYTVAETVEELNEGMAAVSALVSSYRSYYKDARTLTNLIILSKASVAATDYAGKADFQSAITAAEAVEQDGATSADFITSSPADYATAMQTLATARTTYEMSKGANADGSYDFLNIVAYPFFCLPQYNPVWNEETQKWESNSVALDGDGTLLGWSSLGESGTGDDCTYTTTRVRLADGITIGSDTTSCYAWYQTNTSGYEPYWNHKLSSAKQWSTPGERREIVQNLVGLPNGYYSLKGLGITWTNDWASDNPCDMGIYMKSSNGTVSSSEDTYQSGWWGYDINDWSYYSTGMLQVTDGTLRVAFHANGFSSFTGMQLTYYGENPNFTAMIQARVAETQASATEKLILGGDQTHVSDLLATIPAEVTGFDAYEAALDTINAANTYITTASDYLNSNDPTSLYSDLQVNYQPEDTVYQVLDMALLKTFEVYGEPTATYTDVQALVADYNAYVHYIAAIDGYKSASTTTDEMRTLMDEQLSALMAEAADADKLADYEAALQKLNVLALLADVDLTQASESNPVDVTMLITNPSFTESNTGWTGDITVDTTLENAERYNTNFNIYQTLVGLPAGAYRVTVQSFYRDGGFADCYNHTRYDEDGGYQPNVIFYANDHTSEVVSLTNADANFTDRSFTEYTFIGTNPNAEEGEEEVTLRAWLEETTSVDETTGETTYEVTSWKQQYDNDGVINNVDASEAWMYDSWMVEGEDRFFFPNSMRGAAGRFANDGGAYLNTVEVMVGEDGELTIGLRKDVTIDADWCLFDNFKLYYLGTDTPTGIDSAAASSASAREFYSVDGRRIAAPQKGVNIIRMSDGTVRKVLVK